MSPVDSPAFPSPASSLAETVLPTPDQPYSSRRSSLASPRFDTLSPVDDSVPVEPDITPKRRSSETVPVASVVTDLQHAGSYDIFVSAPSPLNAVAGESSSRPLGGIPGMSTNHTHRNRRGTSGSIRAAPPPPIMLRRSTDVNPHAVDVPLKSGSSATGSAGAKSPRSPGGLNISGLPNMDGAPELQVGVEHEHEHEERRDSLSDLLQTPARPFFGGSDPNGAPVSPAWQPIEHNAASPGLNGSPGPLFRSSPGAYGHGVQGRHKARGSLDVPFSPLGPKKAEGRFDPTPQHGIHARNLSLFFPQPGQAPPGRRTSLQGDMLLGVEVHDLPAGRTNGAGEKKPFGGSGAWSFGQPQAQATLMPGDVDDTKRSKRRGHHHKHSLSHNFFSFLDSTQTNPSLATNPAMHKPADTPQKVPMPAHLLSAPTITPSSPTLSPLPPSKNSSRRQMLASFGVLEFLIGAGLWVEGQMSGWRCLAGLGYLVVFDAMGVGVMLLGNREGWSNVRRPTARFLSLMYFAQSLFLVFSAVYIAKESLEQVVLGAGAHDHAGGGAHSHGEIMSDGEKLPFPRFLLVSALVASLFSGSALGNHTKLVEAVGPLFLPHGLISLRFAQKWSGLLSNPFSLTVAGCSVLILVGSQVLHESAFTSLDSALSLLLTVLTSALAYPPTLAFGHVLLQTAPPATSSQMKLIRRALKDVSADTRVLGVDTVRCWSIGATTAQEESQPYTPVSAPNSAPSSPRTPQFGFSPTSSPVRHNFFSPASLTHRSEDSAEGTPLVVSVNVHVHPDASDRDVLELTKYAWMKVSGAAGTGGKGRLGEREVTVSIKRGWDGVGH